MSGSESLLLNRRFGLGNGRRKSLLAAAAIDWRDRANLWRRRAAPDVHSRKLEPPEMGILFAECGCRCAAVDVVQRLEVRGARVAAPAEGPVLSPVADFTV